MYTKAVPAKNPLKSILVDEHGVEMHRQSRFITNIKTEDGAGDANAGTQFKELESVEQRIQVHYFGDTKVPIGKDDEERYKGHNFNEGEQRGCMKLIQFTKREHIKDCYFIGRNSFIVVPGWEKKTSERDMEAMRTTLSLITAMQENDVIAICRYAPDAAKHLQLMALIPQKDEELDLPYLLGLRLPFAEDMRPFNFSTLDATCPKPSHNQLNLVDELIDTMQFSAENGSLEPESVLNPFFQRQCTAMKLKALNTFRNGDDSKICDLIAPSSFLKRGLEPDAKMLECSQHILDAMNSDENGFSLQEVVKMKRPKQEIRQEDISEWLAELEASQKDEVEEKKKNVKKPTSNKFIDRARARLSDNYEFHMSSLLDEVSVMTAAEDEEAEQLYPIAHARLTSLRALAIEFERPAEFNEWLLSSKMQWPEWAQYCASRSSPSLISNAECSTSEYSESEAAAVWND
ncbi:Ku70/Ku80 beta-barrel domain protein [Oesophagostomum dentatum]|uniref:Ku70/Ku80 beta-barrel domain protein n=1 Tax=Oesophagostomum dentatum TaxID=61180 RepID=A0A0B1TDL7_OESDE|nr:Ku70/Ku80 beta-barrel domain protein [Oesophagostomum dentatum]